MLQFKSITLRRGVKIVLQNASFTLQPGEKASLVGRNGAGKSSLFSLLTGRLQSDQGEVEMPPRWEIAEVAQDMPETETGATEFVLEGDKPLMAARAALAAAEAADDGLAIGEAHALLGEVGAFDAPARAQSLLLGLGFRVSQLDAPVNSFSGGWRMRLQLARALMCPGDLLLMDEPTSWPTISPVKRKRPRKSRSSCSRAWGRRRVPASPCAPAGLPPAAARRVPAARSSRSTSPCPPGCGRRTSRRPRGPAAHCHRQPRRPQGPDRRPLQARRADQAAEKSSSSRPSRRWKPRSGTTRACWPGSVTPTCPRPPAPNRAASSRNSTTASPSWRCGGWNSANRSRR